MQAELSAMLWIAVKTRNLLGIEVALARGCDMNGAEKVSPQRDGAYCCAAQRIQPSGQHGLLCQPQAMFIQHITL